MIQLSCAQTSEFFQSLKKDLWRSCVIFQGLAIPMPHVQSLLAKADVINAVADVLGETNQRWNQEMKC